jgi:hypothetical protein
MSFETVSLLLNWMQMGALLAILFRLASTFELIASTQRELRRAIHHLGERRSTEQGANNAFGESNIALGTIQPFGDGQVGYRGGSAKRAAAAGLR